LPVTNSTGACVRIATPTNQDKSDVRTKQKHSINNNNNNNNVNHLLSPLFVTVTVGGKDTFLH
jgi:hypothetical protein